jgi:predicted amidohydrolase YtcJ
MDFFLEIIEEGSRDAGMTPEQIRAKRHVIDHCTMSPRPEQYARIKELGITMSCANKYLEGARDIVADYGERYLSWVAPVRSLIDAGIPTVWEMDTHEAADHGTFHYLQVFVTREVAGGTWAPEQRIGRTVALKMATTWAAAYVLRENDLGTLEAGKKGDFVVLDRDYWQVPEREIHTVRPVMTVVDGHVRFLDRAWAPALDMAPVGYQPERAAAPGER